MSYEKVSIEGTPLGDCLSCPYQENLLSGGQCKLGDACIQVKSGRQIDRFFRNNPALADSYLEDSFWETRAIAIRYASQQRLIGLINDEDEVVRRAVAYRLPIEDLELLAKDQDREVRITVADRLPLNKVEIMVDDDDYLVRVYVARRLAPGRLFRMMCDKDDQVRRVVAERISPMSLAMMIHDNNAMVRKVVAERIDPDNLVELINDSDWTIRLIVAQRAPLDVIKTIKAELEPDVISVINSRLLAG